MIGISGKMGVGKSTLADHIQKLQPKKYIRVAFADLLKEEVAKRFDFPLALCYYPEGKEELINHKDLPNGGMTVRQILQWWGTDIRRKEDPLHWVKVMHRHTGKGPKLIDDIRFPEEAEYVQSQYGFLVRIHPYPEWQPGPYANHSSETALDDWTDWTLELTPEFGQLEQAAELVKGVWENGSSSRNSRPKGGSNGY